MHKDQTNLDRYLKQTHLIGRAASLIAMLMLLAAPFAMGRVLGAMPDMAAVGRGFLSVGIIWMVSSVVEFLVYTPHAGCWRRISCFHYRQPDQYEDPLRCQCKGYRRGQDRYRGE